jgi:hypothetical protein
MGGIWRRGPGGREPVRGVIRPCSRLVRSPFVPRASSVGCAGSMRVFSVAAWPQDGPDLLRLEITFGAIMLVARRHSAGRERACH